LPLRRGGLAVINAAGDAQFVAGEIHNQAGEPGVTAEEKIMSKFVPIAVGGVVLCVAAILPTTLYAAVGRNVAPAIDAIQPVEKAGCYRLGETGYHWYRFCFGPSWLYPHERVCRRGHCWYR